MESIKVFIKKPFKCFQKGTVAILCIFAAVMFVVAGNFSSCSKKGSYEETDHFIGSWKIEKEYCGFLCDSRNISQYDVVYEFLPNGVFFVSGPNNNHSEIFKPGEYLYSIEEIEKGYLFSKTENSWYLKINNTVYYLYVSSNILTMYNAEYGDASFFTFKRIK